MSSSTAMTMTTMMTQFIASKQMNYFSSNSAYALAHIPSLGCSFAIYITILRIFVFVGWITLIQTVSQIHFKIFNLFLLFSPPFPIRSLSDYIRCTIYICWVVGLSKLLSITDAMCIFQSFIFIMIFCNWVSWVLHKLQCKSHGISYHFNPYDKL